MNDGRQQSRRDERPRPPSRASPAMSLVNRSKPEASFARPPGRGRPGLRVSWRRADRLTRIHQFDDGAIVIQRIAAAEVGDGGENIFEGRTLGGHCFQTRIFEEIAARVFRFGDSVGDQDQAIASVQTDVVALISRVSQQADRQIRAMISVAYFSPMCLCVKKRLAATTISMSGIPAVNWE